MGTVGSGFIGRVSIDRTLRRLGLSSSKVIGAVAGGLGRGG